MKFYYPVKECDDCCHWAVLGKDHCVYHLHKPAKTGE